MSNQPSCNNNNKNSVNDNKNFVQVSRYSALQLTCDTGKISFGHVDTIMESFSCWHDKLSSIIWTPVYTAPNCGTETCPICNQPRSVTAGNLAPESSHIQSFLLSCDVVFSLMMDVTSLFMSLFLAPDPSQTEVLGKFLEIYFWAVRFPPISVKRKGVRM